ncbi:MAG TPA: glycosyltransferase family 87 protein [Caulobacteraceae bacterium]
MTPDRSTTAARLLAAMSAPRTERLAFIAFIVAFLACDVILLRVVLTTQPAAVDLMPLWVGARADPQRLYDFAYITDMQTWIHPRSLRPFVYPPSALLLFKPLSLLPFWWAYGVFMTVSAAFFAWASKKLGADWRLALLPMPVVLVALAGQVTFLIGALVMAALSLRARPILAGVLFGLAGALKPQMLVLLPLALMIEGNWRAFWSTGATAIACALVSLAFGASWSEWLQALPRFADLFESNWTLVATSLSPFARWGAASYLVSVPAALAGVWFAFRSGSAAQKVIALLGGALLLSPYAMNYEIALLVPGVLALRRSLLWSAPFWLALALFPAGPLSLATAMGLLFMSMAPQVAAALKGLRLAVGRTQQA